VLAKRHKVEAKKDSASAQELLAKQVGKYEETETLQAAPGDQSAGFGPSARHRKPRRRSHGRRQTLPSGQLETPKNRGKELAAKREKKANKPMARKTRA
jgi:hypothetical protein